MSQLSLEQQYLGETRQRRPAVAFLLSLLSPAAGFTYVGRLGAGVVASTLMVALWFAFVIVWTKYGFFPTLPLAAFSFGWALLALMLGVDAAREAHRVGDDYVLRDANHPLAYVTLALCTSIIPLAGVAHLATQSLWSTARVEHPTMYPSLVPGDELLVRNQRPTSRAPERGEIILYQLDDNTLHFGRVIGTPGDEVVVNEDALFTNDVPALRFRATPAQKDEVLQMSGDGAADLQIAFESIGPRNYPIALPHQHFVAQPERWTLGEDQLVVLNDNRAERTDSRQLGPIRMDQVRGRPLFVLHSQVEASSPLALATRTLVPGTNAQGFRANRVERRVQPRVQPSASR